MYGLVSRREFNPLEAGGTRRRLGVERIRITSQGVDVVERHVRGFAVDGPNEEMLARLRKILLGQTAQEGCDVNFYAHELREFVRYRRLRRTSRELRGTKMAAVVWENAHAATIEEYRIPERDLYHASLHHLL